MWFSKKSTKISEEIMASIFSTEEEIKPESNMMKLVFLFCARFIFKRDDRGGIFFLKVC
jgi:hypothetical protein